FPLLDGLLLFCHLVGSQLAIVGAEQQQQILNAVRRRFGKGQHLPEFTTTVRRVEDVVKPALCVLKPLILAQSRSEERRCVEEHLPVVKRIGAAGVEIYFLHRVGLGYVMLIGVVALFEWFGMLNSLVELLGFKTKQSRDMLPS